MITKIITNITNSNFIPRVSNLNMLCCTVKYYYYSYYYLLLVLI